MSKKQLPFFVYGTLRLGQGNHYLIEKGVEHSECGVRLADHHLIGRGSAAFPFMISEDQVPTSYTTMSLEQEEDVIGDLLFIEPRYYESVLKVLDQLEAVPDMYTREIVGVEDLAGNTVSAWAYRASAEVVKDLLRNPFIQSNDWNQLTAERNRYRK